MKCMLNKKSNSFTLIELLITISISSLIIVSSMYIFYGSYFFNINQRKTNTKLIEINYALEYIENELVNAVEISKEKNGFYIKKYSYNSFISNNSNSRVSKINKISYNFEKNNNNYDVIRISKDYLNTTNYGNNKLLDGIDFYEYSLESNCIAITLGYKNYKVRKIIELNNINRFNNLEVE